MKWVKNILWVFKYVALSVTLILTLVVGVAFAAYWSGATSVDLNRDGTTDLHFINDGTYVAVLFGAEDDPTSNDARGMRYATGDLEVNDAGSWADLSAGGGLAEEDINSEGELEAIVGIDFIKDADINSEGGLETIVGADLVKIGDAAPITISLPKPLYLAEADNFILFRNETGYTFTISSIYSVSDTDNTAFTLKEMNDPHDFTDITTIEAITIATNGTDCYYDDRTSGIDHTVIEDGHSIAFDNDAADDPDSITICIVGVLS